jgi:hypothetical protein
MSAAPKLTEQCKSLHLINGRSAWCPLSPLSMVLLWTCAVLDLIRTSIRTDVFRKGWSQHRALQRYWLLAGGTVVTGAGSSAFECSAFAKASSVL